MVRVVGVGCKVSDKRVGEGGSVTDSHTCLERE